MVSRTSSPVAETYTILSVHPIAALALLGNAQDMILRLKANNYVQSLKTIYALAVQGSSPLTPTLVI